MKDDYYNVTCHFTDGTKAEYLYLSVLDLTAVVATFDNLDVTSCIIVKADA